MSHYVLHLVARNGFTLVMLALIGWAAWPLWRDRKSRSRGRRVNVQCVLSVIFLLLAFFVAGVGQFTLHYVQLPQNRFKVGCVLLALLSISVTWAVLGLIQLNRRSWQTGHRRAKAVLGTVVLCFGSLLVFTWGTVVFPPEEPESFLSRHLNFRFEIDKPWTRVRARTLDPAAVLGLTRAKPAMTFTVAATPADAMSPLTTRAFAEAAKARLAQRVAGVKVIEETPMKLHEIEGVLIESSEEGKGPSRLYFQWVAVIRGASYELTMSGETGARQIKR